METLTTPQNRIKTQKRFLSKDPLDKTNIKILIFKNFIKILIYKNIIKNGENFNKLIVNS